MSVYNPLLKDLNKTIQQYLPLLYSDPKMKDIFPEGSIKAYYKRHKNLKEILSPSAYPNQVKVSTVSDIRHCNKRCNICDNFMIFGSSFTCTATQRKYSIKGVSGCNSVNVIYLITCKGCLKQYVGSAKSFKERFRVHKSDINTGKERCGISKHLINYCNENGKFANLQIQVIECVSVGNQDDVEDRLWAREKYWQAQLFTLTRGLNSPSEWFSTNRKGYRK